MKILTFILSMLITQASLAYSEPASAFFNRLSDHDSYTAEKFAESSGPQPNTQVMKWVGEDGNKIQMIVSGNTEQAGLKCRFYQIDLGGYRTMGKLCFWQNQWKFLE